MADFIKPTIGRKIYYNADDSDIARGVHVFNRSVPLDANIVYVWSDTCINLAGFDHAGAPFMQTSVPINLGSGPGQAYWMPYQVGQAKKHEGTVTQEGLDNLHKEIDPKGLAEARKDSSY